MKKQYYELSDKRKEFNESKVEILGIHRKDQEKFKVRTFWGQELIVKPDKLTPLKKVEAGGETYFEHNHSLKEFITSHPSKQLFVYP